MPTSPVQTYWIDVPTKYHANGCGFAFADGHSEIHGWRDPNAINNVTYGSSIGGAQGPLQPNDPDIHWVAEHTTALIQ